MIDTLRADAVSAYGAVKETSPYLDRLASEGLLYLRAYADAPWTIPSHASLFTGLRPDQHGVGVDHSVTASDELVTLAERLRDVGYETVGFAENPFVSEMFGMTQGFERFSSQTVAQLVNGDALDLDREVERWGRVRESDRPFFLFLNLMDPHEPYELRDENPFYRQG